MWKLTLGSCNEFCLLADLVLLSKFVQIFFFGPKKKKEVGTLILNSIMKEAIKPGFLQKMKIKIILTTHTSLAYN